MSNQDKKFVIDPHPERRDRWIFRIIEPDGKKTEFELTDREVILLRKAGFKPQTAYDKGLRRWKE